MKRINVYKQTEAMAIDVKAKGMPGKVYNLAAGDPNLPVCDALKETFAEVDFDKTHNYGSSQGELSLRNRLWHNPNQVIIADGAKQLMYEALATVTKPGDRVVLIGPCWTSYMRQCEILGLDYVLLTGEEAERYIPSLELVEETVTPSTAAVVINNPCNPTGVVYPEAYIEGLYDITQKNECFLIADEIYQFLTDDIVMTLRGMDDVIVIDGFSKCMNISGWRMGYAIADEKIIRSMTALQSQLSGPPSTLFQTVIADAWPGIELADFTEYRKRIDCLCDIDKFSRHRPQGGFYFYLPVDDRWSSSVELCEYMLEKYSIALTPGDDYGVERTVRISVANITTEELMEIKEFLREI